MKHIARLLPVLIILFLFACQKDGIKNTTRNKNTISTTGTDTLIDKNGNIALTGKWKVVGNMISSGGPMYFVPATGNDNVEFNANGEMSGSEFAGFTSYTIKDTVTLHMLKADNTTYADYRCTIKGDSLSMSPAGPTYCIEGCVIKLVKE